MPTVTNTHHPDRKYAVVICLVDSSVGIATGYGLDGPGIESSGYGGLVVSMLASGTQDRGFAPDRSRRIFPAGKIHSMQYDTIQTTQTTIESPIPGQ
jgi:hypothetical protein